MIFFFDFLDRRNVLNFHFSFTKSRLRELISILLFFIHYYNILLLLILLL